MPSRSKPPAKRAAKRAPAKRTALEKRTEERTELRRATADYLGTLELVPYQRVFAALALELANQVEVNGTAAAAEQLRRTILDLVPRDDKAHRSSTNATEIRAAADD